MSLTTLSLHVIAGSLVISVSSRFDRIAPSLFTVFVSECNPSCSWSLIRWSKSKFDHQLYTAHCNNVHLVRRGTVRSSFSWLPISSCHTQSSFCLIASRSAQMRNLISADTITCLTMKKKKVMSNHLAQLKNKRWGNALCKEKKGRAHNPQDMRLLLSAKPSISTKWIPSKWKAQAWSTVYRQTRDFIVSESTFNYPNWLYLFLDSPNNVS